MSPQDGEPGRLETPTSNTIDQLDLDLAKAESTSGTALERIRKNAADWRTGLAGLLTIVTTALVFKGPEKASAYAAPYSAILGLIAIAAAACGGIGLWLLLLAANGGLDRVTRDEVRDAGGYTDWMQRKTDTVERIFRRGRLLTGCAAALVGLLIIISWYAQPTASDPPAYVRVTEMGEALPLCGTLQVADAKGVTFKIAGQRDDHTTPFAKLVSIVLVDKCP